MTLEREVESLERFKTPHRNTKSEEAIAMLHVVTCISLLCKIPGLTWRL